MKTYLKFIFLLLSLNLFSKEIYINGFISDVKNGEILTEVYILDSITGNTYKTNESGFFSIPTQPGLAHLKFETDDYSSVTFIDSLTQDTIIEYELKRKIFNGSRKKKIVNFVKSNTLSVEDSKLYIDKSLLYNQKHMFSLIPTVNEQIVNAVVDYSNKLPARVDGLTEPVFDIISLKGNNRETNLDLKLGTVDNSFCFQSPIGNKKTKILVAGRKSILNSWLPSIIENNIDTDADLNYNMYDINTSVYHQFSSSSEVFVNFFKSCDDYSFINEFENKSKTKTEALWENNSVNLIWNKKLTSNLYSRLRYNHIIQKFQTGEGIKIGNSELDNLLKTKIQSGILHFDFDYYREDHYIKFGLNYHRQVYDTELDILNTSIVQEQTSSNKSYESNLFNIYAEDNYNILHFIDFNLGMRMTGYFYDGNSLYSSMQPRFSLKIRFNEDFSSDLSFSQTNTYLMPVANNNVYSPINYYVPATNNISPEKSLQFNIGIKYNFMPDFYISLSSSIKRLNNLLEFKSGNSYLDPLANDNDLAKRIVQADGFQRQYRFRMQKDAGNFYGKLEYIYSDYSYNNDSDEKKFESINNGNPFIGTQPKHNLVFVGDYYLFQNLKATCSYVMHSGRNVSIKNAIVNDNSGNLVYIYNKNEQDLRSYQRLDIGLNYYTQLLGLETDLGVHVYNALGNFNTNYIGPNLNSHNQYTEYSFIPFMPTISCKISI